MTAARKSSTELRSVNYWQNQPHDEQGVMGGFSHLSPIDETNSRRLIKQEFLPYIQGERFQSVADLGAGIGRVTKRVLLPYSAHVDLFEPVEGNRAIAAAELKDQPVSFYDNTLQNWEPQSPNYDLVWIQFAIIYATDLECAVLFTEIARSLAPNGLVVVKDNMKKARRDSSSLDCDFSSEDCSYVRSEEHLIKLAQSANLVFMKSFAQEKWPEQLYPVRTLLFRRADPPADV